MSLRILAKFCERLGLAQGLAQKAQTWPTVWPREEANPLSNCNHRKNKTNIWNSWATALGSPRGTPAKCLGGIDHIVG